MSVAFRCQLQYNSDITKIHKFFENTDTLRIGAGEAGIALYDITAQNTCYNMAIIHSCDIYRLSVDTSFPVWAGGGIFRSMPAAKFISFTKFGTSEADLSLEIDKDGTELTVSILNGNTQVRSETIPLTIPDLAYEYPTLRSANIILKVNDFKKLASHMSKVPSEIRIEAQPDAIHFVTGTQRVAYGNWDEKLEPSVYNVKKEAFARAKSINIGNAKNSLAGIYMTPGYPMMIKVKLGIIDFLIYSTVTVPI